jgi:uncharacterized protein YodC (DUF2158 family)
MNEGDVRLKSGGPDMTVEKVEGDLATCIWFDGKNQPQNGKYRVSTLKKVPDGNGEHLTSRLAKAPVMWHPVLPILRVPLQPILQAPPECTAGDPTRCRPRAALVFLPCFHENRPFV